MYPQNSCIEVLIPLHQCSEVGLLGSHCPHPVLVMRSGSLCVVWSGNEKTTQTQKYLLQGSGMALRPQGSSSHTVQHWKRSRGARENTPETLYLLGKRHSLEYSTQIRKGIQLQKMGVGEMPKPKAKALPCPTKVKTHLLLTACNASSVPPLLKIEGVCLARLQGSPGRKWLDHESFNLIH
ncbi:hypothetical protein H1C71_032206 [Ictidomys tridecemlineatus]|nr:hypothetical protein H1C71_032206 [Ictidomys tridecemlineatus]